MIRVWLKNLACPCCLSTLQPSHRGTAVGLIFPTGKFSHLFLYPYYKTTLLSWANHFQKQQCLCCKWGNFMWIKCSPTTAEPQRQAELLQLRYPHPQGFLPASRGSKPRAGHTFALVWKGWQMALRKNTLQSDPSMPICTLWSLPNCVCKTVGFLVCSSLAHFLQS